ncbi:MAG: MFS transporter [Ilumatobacteraceae bacterium]
MEARPVRWTLSRVEPGSRPAGTGQDGTGRGDGVGRRPASVTGSGFALRAAIGIQFLPLLLFGPLAGVVIDRVRIPRLLMVTAALAGLEALTLGVLTSTGHINVAWILCSSFVLGVVQVGDRAGAQVFLAELVPREQLPSAVGLSSVAQSVGRLGGPALAAALYAWRGGAICFYANAVSYVAVIVSLLVLRQRELLPRPTLPRQKGQLRDGLRFAWQSPLLRSVLLANALIGMLTFNFAAFYSSLVRLTFHADARAVPGRYAVLRVGRGDVPDRRAGARAAALADRQAGPDHEPVHARHDGHDAGRGLITGWLTDAVSPRASLALGGVAPFLCAGWILWRASSASRDQFAGPVLSLDDRVDRVDRSHRRGVS